MKHGRPRKWPKELVCEIKKTTQQARNNGVKSGFETAKHQIEYELRTKSFMERCKYAITGQIKVKG